MGEALIKQIQDTVIKYANIISNVVNVDVEIVDTNFYRIAGTGIYKNKIDEDISDEAFVYTEVIKTGKHHIIENPGKHPLCSQCEHKECCVEKMQISTPIKFNDEIIGVIGLICSCEEQKTILLEKMETYIEFLYQIADFISAKLFAYLEAERNKKIISLFKQIIDSMDNGVLVVNIDGKIFHINKSAMKQLKLTPSHINEAVEIISKNEFIMDKEEFTVKIGSKQYCLLGQLLPMTPIIPDCNRIFIFNQIKKLKADAYKLTNAHQVVKVERILGQSKSMVSLKSRIKKIAASKSTVLITGDSGTGKELIARAIHSESDRSDRPFIAINCGAIPDALLESELFGYVKGAFSGANPNGRIGKFELANKGVIFLDEIGDMPLHLQVKILRIL
jgi:transcriptional regulator with PAS, ATPase and Fis domain